jgi:hypothetical protein
LPDKQAPRRRRELASCFEIYAERNANLEVAVDLANTLKPVGLSKKPEDRMIMERIPTQVEHKKPFMLER